MTWSIVARDPATGAIGIAVATRFFAVGARVPHIASGIGAVATQALVNPFYGTRGLQLLREGVPAPDVVRLLTEADTGRAHRQVHVVDAVGHIAAHTGSNCVDWCGHVIRDGFSVAGNMLAGPRVVEDTAATYAANAAFPFPRRLIAALKAGEAVGGDKRGKQSAALLIHGDEEYSDLDLRVDDHADPLAELERLETVSRQHWVLFRKFMPTRRDPAGTTDRTTIEAGIAAGQVDEHEPGPLIADQRGEIMDTEALRKAVINVPERHRYELATNSGIAFVDYRLTDNVAVVPHTEVPRALEGQGVGTALVLGALDRMREQGRKVVPRCGFFARVVARHPEQRDLLA